MAFFLFEYPGMIPLVPNPPRRTVWECTCTQSSALRLIYVTDHFKHPLIIIPERLPYQSELNHNTSGQVYSGSRHLMKVKCLNSAVVGVPKKFEGFILK
jgi:hypothetical protein